MSKGLAAKLPLTISETFGPYDLHRDVKGMVQQNIKMLLLTNPGERMMDPDFGIGLTTYLHEMNTESLQKEILARIESQMDTYLDFIEVESVFLGPDENSLQFSDNTLSLSIKYKIVPISEEDILTITLSDFGF